MKNKVILSIFFICFFLDFIILSQAYAGSGNSMRKMTRVSGGSSIIYEFNFENNENYDATLIRVQIPDNSLFKIIRLIDCPVNKDKSNNYVWTSNFNDTFATCQTSPNSKNPNLIKPGESVIVRVEASVPLPDVDTIYSWKTIVEYKPDFERLINIDTKILVDVTPPKIISAELRDEDNDYYIDTARIEFSEDVNIAIFQKEDFTVGGIAVKKIKSKGARVYDLVLDNNDFRETGRADLLYTYRKGFGQDLYNHSMLSIEADDLEEKDFVKPKVISSSLSGEKTISLVEKMFTINFSEDMDSQIEPVVELAGENGDIYKLEKIKYDGRIWQGKIILIKKDLEQKLELKISGFSDLAGNTVFNKIFLGNHFMDTKGPNAVLNNLPLAFTGVNEAQIFVSGKNLEYYRYALNDNNYGEIIASTTPIIVLKELKDDDYQIKVQGKDDLGNWQTMPTMYKWTVKTVVPELPKNKDSNKKEVVVDNSGSGGGGLIIRNPIPDNKITKKVVVSDFILDQINLEANQVYIKQVPLWRMNSSKVDIGKIYKKYTKKIISNELVTADNVDKINYFIAHGTDSTIRLGAGERAGILNSFVFAYGGLPNTVEDWDDVIKIGNGRWPKNVSATAKKNANLKFRTIYLRAPDDNSSFDNNAIAVMAYGLRPLNRNLESEKQAIIIFKKIFKKSKISTNDWDVIRAIAYSGATR